MDKYTKETINRVCQDNLTEYTIRTNTQMGNQKLSGQTHKSVNNVRTNTQREQTNKLTDKKTDRQTIQILI